MALKKRIVHEKGVFLLSDLLKDIKCSSVLNALTEHVLSNARTLKRRIINKFSDDISLQVFHSSDVNPREYVLPILKGKGLKDYDIIK